MYSLDVLLSYLEPVCCSCHSNCCFLTCIQVSQEAGQVVWHSHFFKNFRQFLVIHTVKGFGIVNKAEIDAFLELSCFFDNPADVGNLISGSTAFSKASLVVHVDLICSLYNWWEGFGSSALATLPLGFICGFISTSACGPFTGVCSWGCPAGLGSTSVRVRCRGGLAAWVATVLAAPGTQGSWRLEKQDI